MKRTVEINMKRTIRTTIFGLLGATTIVFAQTGIMPIPQIDTAVIAATVEIVPAAGGQPTQYIYRYTVTNPASSSDGYYKFSLDISAKQENSGLRPTLQTFPADGGASTTSFDDELALFAEFPNGFEGQGAVPIGLECPPGWNGGLRRNATVVCYTMTDTPRIAPGTSMSGFAIHSRLPPMLREVDTTAFWTVVVDNFEGINGEVDRAAAFQVLSDLRRPKMTIGPSFAFPRDREHYKTFVRDLVDMVSLGWIPNATLADELADIIEDAGNLFRTGQGTAAKLRLDDVVTALANATEADILPDAATFLLVNVDSIQEFGSNTFPFGGLDTQLRFVPEFDSLKVSETFELETFAFRLDNADFRSGVVEAPNLNAMVYFGCDHSAPVDPGVDPCPNVPLGSNPFPNSLNPVPVDANGIARFSYVGDVIGRDHIQLCLDNFCEGVLGRVTVDWNSAIDLVIQAFSPPIIKAASGELITFTDRTANFGDGPSDASITAFYISDLEVVDPQTAIFVGDRDVPILLPGEASEEINMQFQLPAGLPLGVYNLIACADDAEGIEESDELNNCSNVQVEGSEFIAIPVADFEDLLVVTVNDASVIEGDSGTRDVLIDIELSQPNLESDITFDYELEDGTATIADNDYVDTSGTITFPAGSGGPQTQQISVSIVGDTVEEQDETVVLRVMPVAGDALYRTTSATVTIVNDDSIAELDCSVASASPISLWPPNHKLVSIVFSGITTQDGEPAQFSVTGIEQDEPVNGLGDGDTSPDGFGVGTDSPQVRRERSGTGDGRAYFIGFDATDSSTGASCSGTVSVGVPHDQGQGSVPIDSGLRFDSTAP